MGWFAANEGGSVQMLRTPFIVLPDVDHSDMCQGFNVPGDLPSASLPTKATETLTKATASFIRLHMMNDTVAATEMQLHIEFTRPMMEPFVAGLNLDLRSAKWCSQMQLMLAGKFSGNISISASYHSELNNWGPPNASVASDGKVAVRITGHNEYEDDGGLWPPGSDAPPPFEYAARSQIGAPLPMRDT